MTQASLFSAELAPPQLADLGGLLAAHGQITSADGGARLSILLADRWRAQAVREAYADRGLTAEIIDDVEIVDDGAAEAGRHGAGRFRVRTERTPALAGLAAAWVHGAVKAVPAGLVADAGLLRLWVLAAGRPGASGGYLLKLDPHAPHTHQALAAACGDAGLRVSVVGVRAGGPALRLATRNRVARLAVCVGDPPPGAPADAFPSGSW